MACQIRSPDEPGASPRASYATEWVIVPLYVPATAAAGTFTVSVGFHVAELFPTIAAAEYAVREALRAWAFPDVA
jgi:hypothetical protein